MLFSYREPPDLKGLAGHAFCEVVIAAFASLGACRCARFGGALLASEHQDWAWERRE